MNESRICELAESQLSDYRARRPGTVFEDPLFRPTLEDAYRIQLAAAALRERDGERRAGFKVGATGTNIGAQFGLQGPVSGSVWESEVHVCGAALPADDYARPAVEGEIALRLGPDGRPIAVFPVIEIHNFLFRAEPWSLQELVVNNAIHAGVVLPCADETPWPAEVSGSIRVLVNDLIVDEGPANGVPGGPEGSLRWLRAHLNRFGLRPFGLVLTGTALSLIPVSRGDKVRVETDTFGHAEMRLV